MKILFVVDRFFPHPYANTVCAQKIIDLFNEDGDQTDILAFSSSCANELKEYHGSRVFYVKPDLRFRLFYYSDDHPRSIKGRIARFLGKILAVSNKIIGFRKLPKFSHSFPKRIGNSIEKLYEQNQYDLIVTFVQPFDGAYALYRLKKKHKLNVKWFIYCFDTLDYPVFEKLGIHYSQDEYWMKRFLPMCDCFICIASRREQYSKKSLLPYSAKIVTSDLPLYEKKKESNQAVCSDYFHNGAENWCYFGSVSVPHYNPKDLVSFFESLPKDKKRVLHFFARGSYLPYLRKKAKESNGLIEVHDYVSPELIPDIEASTDYLVSMKYSENISAKIFGYFSSGKPIIHFSGVENDVDVQYLKKYPQSCIIKTYNGSVKDWIEVFSDFQKESKDEPFSKDAFEMNTPEYSANVIRNASQIKDHSN